MEPKRWRHVDRLFNDALDRTPSERAAFLDLACAGDIALREEIESLIRYRDKSSVFLQLPSTSENTNLSGSQIGSYQILELLGSGGMGKVYRARDTRLKRDVAMKVLPEGFSRDPQRVNRFRREAETLAALNHPNIAGIYDVQEINTRQFLVLELVEGQTLASILNKRGALPIDEVVRIAKHICNALEAAHERGIVHRDLKPGNVMVTNDGTVKLLDFGIAKVLFEDDFTNPTGSSLVGTEPNAILGTAPYMSPEQARGKPVDKRTDIWAFGCVLYEALSGVRAFVAETTFDTVAKILEHEPDWSRLPESSPAGLRLLLRRCLVKDPAWRLRDIGEARIQLEGNSSPVSASEISVTGLSSRGVVSTWSHRVAWMIAGLAIVVALVVAVNARVKSAPGFAPVRFLVAPPDGAAFVAASRSGSATIPWPAISPDGRRLAFVATNAEGQQLVWVRPLDSVKAQPLPGSEGGETPFWAPDSQSLGFFAGAKLKRIDAAGTSPQALGDVRGYIGASWGSDGTIIFGSQVRGMSLNRIPASGGGIPSPLTALDVSAGEIFHAWPHFLPDGRHFLYFAGNENAEANAIYVGSLDSPERKRLINITSEAIYAPPGYLLYVRDGKLMAHAFDVKQLTLSGEAVPIAEDVAQNRTTGVIACSVSNDGVLVYRTGGATAANQLFWMDRGGNRLGTVGPPGADSHPRLSRDGKRLVLTREISGTNHLWMVDLARTFPFRFTLDNELQMSAAWSPDGRVGFVSDRGGSVNFYQKVSNGAGAEELLFRSGGGLLEDWSPDGRFLVYRFPGRKTTTTDLWKLPMPGHAVPEPFTDTPYDERQARISPDGKSIAYVANELGHEEVYVQTFPNPSAKVMVSTNGGMQPTWRGDSKELFYVSADRKMMAVLVRGEGVFEAGKPAALFDASFLPRTNGLLYSYWYDTRSDGKQFLMIGPNTSVGAPPMTVVLNWTAALKK